ncbi:Cytochrome b561 [Alphaproteobacteria bacterium SO-S41]|nr:Cytochrome b561 [Alphaproteobacteria bacterium SO-S41]
MRLTNSKDGFGILAVTLHWVIAVAILYMIWLGNYMTKAEDYAAYQLHKSLGITILALSLLRLLIRFIDPPPPLPEHMPWWERLGAHLSHWAFYALMIGIPLSGWAMVSASPNSDFVKTRIWGWFELPLLPSLPTLANREAISDRLEDVHGLLATSVYFLLALHVLAALKHHFWDRDNVLTRMLPFLPKQRKSS